MTKASVIIPTYNRGKLLCSTLKNLIEHIPDDVEIIVVDQSDEVHNELLEITKHYCTLIHYYKICKKGLPYARNYGIKQATGKTVIFCDDDVVPAPDFIKNHLRNYKDPEVGGVGGRIVTERKQCGPFIGGASQKSDFCNHSGKIGKVRRWDAHLIDNFDARERTYIDHLQGCNMSFRKEALTKAGGFDECFRGSAHLEETDLCLRIRKAGYKIIFDPEAELVHLKDAKGGCRTEDYKQWFYWYGHNTMLFFLKNFNHRLFPLFVVSGFVHLGLSACKRHNPMVMVWGGSGYWAGLLTYKSK